MAPVKINPGVVLSNTGRLIVEILKQYPKNDLLTITSSQDGDHGAVSYHNGNLYYQGSICAATDVVHISGGGVSSEDSRVMKELAAWLLTFSALLVELIHSGGMGYYVKNTVRSAPYAVAGHKDHVHIATSQAFATKLLATLDKGGVTVPQYGVDVSYHQGNIDWAKVRQSGISFATMKASHGNASQSYLSAPYFKANAPRMRANIPFVGAYGWLVPQSKASASSQVIAFLDSVKQGLGTYEGYIMQLDVEEGTPADVKAWMAEWNRRTNHYPIIGYIPDWYEAQFAGNTLGDMGFKAYWSSEYVSGTGTYLQLATKITPVHWHSVDGVKPTILQYTSKSSVPGVNGYCDANQTKLSLNELRSLLTRTPSPPSDDDTYLEDDMPRLSDNMTLKYKNPVTGEEETIGITYETYLSLVYQQNQAIMANTESTPPTVGDVVVSED